jgi:hypothetical protein
MERHAANGGEVRALWDALDLEWSYDDLIAFVSSRIPEDRKLTRGESLGLAATIAAFAIEADHDRRPEAEGEHDGIFHVEKTEEGVVKPHAGDRMWGTLNGRRYCVLISRDPMHDDPDDRRWHISVSDEEHLKGGHEVPVWRDFVAIVHQLRPGVPFVLGIPPRSMWMNKCPNVLHALETTDETLIAEWRVEGELVRGTDAGVPS